MKKFLWKLIEKGFIETDGWYIDNLQETTYGKDSKYFMRGYESNTYGHNFLRINITHEIDDSYIDWANGTNSYLPRKKNGDIADENIVGMRIDKKEAWTIVKGLIRYILSK